MFTSNRKDRRIPLANPVLSYGTDHPTLWKRYRLRILVGLLIIGAIYLCIDPAKHFYNQCKRNRWIMKWQEEVRLMSGLEKQLLYSEHPADQRDFPYYPVIRNKTFNYPELRSFQMAYNPQKYYSDNIVYVGIRDWWKKPSGKESRYLAVIYRGEIRGNAALMFETHAYSQVDSILSSSDRISGAAVVPLNLNRPFARVRLFAGFSDPLDSSRFYIPFQCDSGSGRFEFQTDTDATDGANNTPTINMLWDK